MQSGVHWAEAQNVAPQYIPNSPQQTLKRAPLGWKWTKKVGRWCEGRSPTFRALPQIVLTFLPPRSLCRLLDDSSSQGNSLRFVYD